MKTHPYHEMRSLSVAECRARLRLADMGHLAITSKALPLVIPVEVGDLGSELRITSLLGDAIALPEGSVVALEVGEFKNGRDENWSISVRGLLRRLPSQDGEQPALGQVPRPTALFALSMELLTGWKQTPSSSAGLPSAEGPPARDVPPARR